MNRIACVNLPEFPLQLLFRKHPGWARFPAAVVDRDAAQGVILWSNEPARRFRILPGMRYAAALSLSSELRAGEMPESEVTEAVTEAAERLGFYSAGVEPSPHEPGVFWLDASGLSLLYPSLARWAKLIGEDLHALGYRTQSYRAGVVVGFTRFGTCAVAKTTHGECVFDTPEAEREATRKVAINRLGFDPRLRNALFKLGITTVGGFLDLPANGVKKRFGADVHTLYRLARDELFAPLQPQAPQEPLTAAVHIDDPETNIERLLAIVERHLQSLFLRLSQRSEVLAAIVLRLVFDDGERATERLAPARPTLELGQILELLRLRLSAVFADMASRARRGGRGERFHNGVVDVDVEAVGTPALASQGELFVEQSPRDLDAIARAFARLRAEFGERAVVRAVLRNGHLPEARFTWERAEGVTVPRARAVAHPSLIRRLYSRPVTFSPGRHRHADTALTAHIDDGSVADTLGPFVVSGGWWNREVHREYYYVRTTRGRTLWMYYDRRRQRWFIHGEVE